MTSASASNRARKRGGRTALYGYIAARLAGVPQRSLSTYLTSELGLKLSGSAVERAARPRRESLSRKRPRGRAEVEVTRTNPAIREWLRVDPIRLGLDASLVSFPGVGKRQAAVLEALLSTAGVLQVLETGHKRDVLAIVVSEDAEARRLLRAKLAEYAEAAVWDELLLDTQEPAVKTWMVLARNAGEDEGLTVD
jgi:hypothetical protein